jgi:hypothetical protein
MCIIKGLLLFIERLIFHINIYYAEHKCNRFDVILRYKDIRSMERLQKIQEVLVKQDTKLIEGDRLKIVDNRTGKAYEVSVK